MIDTKLKGKVAIVTGANNPYGIGAGIAKALASEQVKVFLQYFRVNVDNDKQLKEPDAPGEEFYNFQRQKDTYEILTAIKQIGGQAHEYECDLSKPEAIRDLIAIIKAKTSLKGGNKGLGRRLVKIAEN